MNKFGRVTLKITVIDCLFQKVRDSGNQIWQLVAVSSLLSNVKRCLSIAITLNEHDQNYRHNLRN